MRLPAMEGAAGHPAIHHCVSRIVDRRFVLKALERRKFRQFLREYAAFWGFVFLTWCVLSNHFPPGWKSHRNPDEPPPLDALIARLSSFSSVTAVSAATARQCA